MPEFDQSVSDDGGAREGQLGPPILRPSWSSADLAARNARMQEAVLSSTRIDDLLGAGSSSPSITTSSSSSSGSQSSSGGEGRPRRLRGAAASAALLADHTILYAWFRCCCDTIVCVGVWVW